MSLSMLSNSLVGVGFGICASLIGMAEGLTIPNFNPGPVIMELPKLENITSGGVIDEDRFRNITIANSTHPDRKNLELWAQITDSEAIEVVYREKDYISHQLDLQKGFQEGLPKRLQKRLRADGMEVQSSVVASFMSFIDEVLQQAYHTSPMDPSMWCPMWGCFSSMQQQEYPIIFRRDSDEDGNGERKTHGEPNHPSEWKDYLPIDREGTDNTRHHKTWFQEHADAEYHIQEAILNTYHRNTVQPPRPDWAGKMGYPTRDKIGDFKIATDKPTTDGMGNLEIATIRSRSPLVIEPYPGPPSRHSAQEERVADKFSKYLEIDPEDDEGLERLQNFFSKHQDLGERVREVKAYNLSNPGLVQGLWIETLPSFFDNTIINSFRLPTHSNLTIDIPFQGLNLTFIDRTIPDAVMDDVSGGSMPVRVPDSTIYETPLDLGFWRNIRHMYKYAGVQIDKFEKRELRSYQIPISSEFLAGWKMILPEGNIIEDCIVPLTEQAVTATTLDILHFVAIEKQREARQSFIDGNDFPKVILPGGFYDLVFNIVNATCDHKNEYCHL